MAISSSSSSDAVPIRDPSISSSSLSTAASVSTSTPNRISDAEIGTIVRESDSFSGLQMMVQKQCEVMVKAFNVSSIMCGIMPTIWLRYVVYTGVYAERWAPSVVTNCQDHLAERDSGYISYQRANTDKSLVYAMPGDYYIIIRALAKVARVDTRLLHACTLELERKLAWIVGRIITRLNVLNGKSVDGPIERCEIEPEVH